MCAYLHRGHRCSSFHQSHWQGQTSDTAGSKCSSPGLVATCCGYSLVRLENKYLLQRAGDTSATTLKQTMFFFGAFYSLKVDLACFAFLFLLPFTHKLLLGFVSFLLLSAILLFLCYCCSFTGQTSLNFLTPLHQQPHNSCNEWWRARPEIQDCQSSSPDRRRVSK